MSRVSEFVMWRLTPEAFEKLDIPPEYEQQKKLQPALYLESGSPPKALLLDDNDQVVFEKDLVEGVDIDGANIR